MESGGVAFPTFCVESEVSTEKYFLSQLHILWKLFETRKYRMYIPEIFFHL